MESTVVGRTLVQGCVVGWGRGKTQTKSREALDLKYAEGSVRLVRGCVVRVVLLWQARTTVSGSCHLSAESEYDFDSKQ